MENDIKKYIKLIKKLATSKEILNLMKLSKDFNKARDSTLSNTNRINILIATILKATSYEERLVEIKIRYQRIGAQLSKCRLTHRNIVMTDTKKFWKMTKKDQEFLIEKESKLVLDAISLLDSKITIVENAIDYVRSANFNMKAVLASLKEYMNGR